MKLARQALKRKPQVVFQSIEGPTSDRLRHAGGFFELGGEDRAHQKFTMLDSPLDKMKARNAIEPKEYAALRKYAHHWYHGGHSPSVGGADLNRIFASNPAARCGMAIGDKQVFHQQQYWAGRELIGHRPGIVVDNVVCAELSLEAGGYSIGWTNRPQAVAAATEILRDAGYRLAKLWGMG